MNINPVGPLPQQSFMPVPTAPTSAPSAGVPRETFAGSALNVGAVSRALFAPVEADWVYRPTLDQDDRLGGAPMVPMGKDVLAGTMKTRTMVDGSTGQPRWTVRLDGTDRFMERPPLPLSDGSLAYTTASDHTTVTTGIAVIDPQSGRLARHIHEESITTFLAAAPGGALCYGNGDGEVVRVGVDGRREVLARMDTRANGAVTGLAVSTDGAVAFCGAGSRKVGISTGGKLLELDLKSNVRAVRSLPAGGFLALSGPVGGPCALTSLGSDGRVQWNREMPGDFRGLAVANDGSLFLLDYSSPKAMLGLDAKGNARWRQPVSAPSILEWPDLHALASGSVVLAQPQTGFMAGYRPDGTKAWEMTRRSDEGQATLTADERFLSSNGGGLRSVDLATGQTLLEFDPIAQHFTWQEGDKKRGVDIQGVHLEISGRALSMPGGELVLPAQDGSLSSWRVPPPAILLPPEGASGSGPASSGSVPGIVEGLGWVQIGDVLLPRAR